MLLNSPLKRIMKSVVLYAPPLFIGLIFLLAAFSKFGDLAEFSSALDNYTVFPDWVKGLAVLIVPGVELVLGINLVTLREVRATSYLATALMFSFTGLALYNTIHGNNSVCHCMKLQLPFFLEVQGWSLVLRDFVLMILAAVPILNPFWKLVET